MKAPTKLPLSFRLDRDSIEILDRFAAELGGVSRVNALRVLLRCAAALEALGLLDVSDPSRVIFMGEIVAQAGPTAPEKSANIRKS